MPYIPQEQRKELEDALTHMEQALSKAVKGLPPDGALNYVFTRLIQKVLIPTTPSYLLLERVTGLLECCKLEFYRRCAAPYENTKTKQNGDVFNWIEDGQLK